LCAESAQIELAQNGLAPLSAMIDVFWLRAPSPDIIASPESERKRERERKAAEENQRKIIKYKMVA
jgi:hypothetical protein